MTREVSEVTLSALEADIVYPFYAFELLFDGNQTVRLWTGYGQLVYQGISYFGTGTLLTVDSVEETTEISAKGATLTLSAVPSEILSLALSEPYQGRKCNIYFGMFGRANTTSQLKDESNAYILLEDGSRINVEIQESVEASLTQIFSGYMDQMDISESAETSTIQLKVENKLIDLERVRVARYTSGYQKSKYPNDKGLDFVEDLQKKEIFWGKTR